MRLGFLAACALVASAQAAVDPMAAVAPRAEFEPPPAGSYQLQRIQGTGDAVLLDAAGQVRHLAPLLHGKVTLLTFFYTYCVDPLGCPFARATLAGLRARVVAEPALAGRVRFVTVSLDPFNDTPEALRAYAAQIGPDPRLEWRLLTAHSVARLLPLLDDFGQDVSVETDARGRPTRTLHHMLKVFLIDPTGTVREIYSLAFLQPQVMFNDIETLAFEAQAARSATGAAKSHPGTQSLR
ncbi:MAG: SCO family protein [Gammaproteobacteria bacterium]|nr:SCO family protein [Gammaproteobacteria bacterium]MBV9697378.1 SCO family protein [Gammaproteobacteria bacterium]